MDSFSKAFHVKILQNMELTDIDWLALMTPGTEG